MSPGVTPQWGIAIPQVFIDGPAEMTLVGQFVTKAEALGYQSLWVFDSWEAESRGDGLPSLEPVNLLSYAAALTTKVRLGTSVLVTPLRHPVHLAKALASLDHMSGGRLTIGVGLGNTTRHDGIFGVPPTGRVRRFVEDIEVMKALWTQPSVTFEGHFWQLNDLSMEPKPVQEPHPPLWFGGKHPNSLRRAVKYADGWMGAGSSSTAQFRETVPQLRQFIVEARRDPSTFLISKRVYLAVDNDKARAGRRLQEWFGRVYGDGEMAARVCVWGSVAECMEQLAEVVTGGAQFILLNPVFDQLEHVELLAKELIPHLSK